MTSLTAGRFPLTDRLLTSLIKNRYSYWFFVDDLPNIRTSKLRTSRVSRQSSQDVFPGSSRSLRNKQPDTTHACVFTRGWDARHHSPSCSAPRARRALDSFTRVFMVFAYVPAIMSTRYQLPHGQLPVQLSYLVCAVPFYYLVLYRGQHAININGTRAKVGVRCVRVVS